jgi:hypothetical protein
MRWLKVSLIVLATLAILLVSIGALLLPPHLEVPAQQDIVVAGVSIINPGVERLNNQTITISKGRITNIRPHQLGDPAPLCEDCYALPGLIDAHVHTPPSFVLGNQQLFALMYLSHGITSIRDVGQSDASVVSFVASLRNGNMVGPYAYRCGPVLEGDPPAWPVATVIPEGDFEAENAATIANAIIDEGADCIKVYNELGPAAFNAIATTAAASNIPLIGHVPHKVGLNNLTDFEAQHLTGVPYLAHPRPPIGWDIRNEDLLAMDQREINQALDILVQNNISLTPTLANFSLRLIASDPSRFVPTPASDMLPPYWADAWNIIAGHPTGEAEISLQLQAVPIMRGFIKQAQARGIDILAGTDTLMPWVVPGESLLLEIDEINKAVNNPEAALASATTVNGRHIAPGDIGQIKIGARADILLLPEDPTLDLHALRRWSLIVANGRLYPRALIDDWMQAYRDHFHGFAQANLMTGLVSVAADQYGHSGGGDD